MVVNSAVHKPLYKSSQIAEIIHATDTAKNKMDGYDFVSSKVQSK